MGWNFWDTALGIAIVERLVRAGARVTVLAAGAERDRFAHQLEPLGVSVVTGSAVALGNLAAAGCENADVLVLAGDDDSTNVDAALAARRLKASLPLVVRVFDSALARYLEHSLVDVTVLSMSGVAAPVFADMALKAIAGRSERGSSIARRAGTVTRRRRVDVDRVLVSAILGFTVLVLASSVYFSRALGLRLLDAMYFVWTTVFTVGYGDISLYQASDEAKAVGMALMFAGAALMAVFYAPGAQPVTASWTLSAPAGAVMDLDAQAVGPKVEGNGFAASFGPYEVKRFLIR